MINYMEAPYRILVVNDDEAQRELLRSVALDAKWILIETDSTDSIVDNIIDWGPDLVLINATLQGVDACHSIKHSPAQGIRDVAVIMLSDQRQKLSRRKSFTAGCDDYVGNISLVEELKIRVDLQVRNRRIRLELECVSKALRKSLLSKSRTLLESQRGLIRALATLAESRDDDTGKHIERVQYYLSILVAAARRKKLLDSFDEAWEEQIIQAACLHDIGKISIPDAVLRKPGKLEPDEFAIMKQHAEEGFATLDAIHQEFPENQCLAFGKAIARSHHEKWDGTGYPQGLRGEEIPLEARLMAIVDVYDALRSVRCYKPAFDHDHSVEIMQQMSPAHFDPVFFPLFLEVSDEFSRVYNDNCEVCVGDVS